MFKKLQDSATCETILFMKPLVTDYRMHRIGRGNAQRARTARNTALEEGGIHGTQYKTQSTTAPQQRKICSWKEGIATNYLYERISRWQRSSLLFSVRLIFQEEVTVESK